ncbi:MAG TPA: hypothetical protein VLC71_07730 [Thermomonas sp.]|nr:hypothetical protein [Thermomonas sp.]
MSSPQAAHQRWRVRACTRVLLFALPWSVVALLVAMRAPARLPAWLPFFASLAVTALWLIHAWRRHDARWLASTLNAHPALDDSAELLLGLEPPGSAVARLQRQRLLDRWPSLDMATITPRQRSAPLLWSLLAAVACAAVVMAWQRPLPRPVRGHLPPAIARALGMQAPSITAIRIAIEPPAYTGLPARVVDSADLQVAEASRLRWTLQFSVAPAKAWLQFEDGPRIALQARDGRWQAERRIERAGLYRIVTEPALPPPQRRLHRIDMVRDQPPQVRAIQPSQSLNLRSAGQRTWPLLFEASDDHGVAASAALRIIQTTGDGENITSSERVVPLNGSGPGRKRRFTHVFDLARSGLTVGNDVIVQLTVRDHRQPDPQVVRSASVILRWPPEAIGMAAGLDGLAKQVLPAYFRSQRQIIIDAEALIRDQRAIAADTFARRSDAIGVDQHALRLRYGQFLGEEAAEARPLPTSDGDNTDAGAPDAHADAHAGAGAPVDGATPGSQVAEMLAEVSHVHDLPEAATLLDPHTQGLLRAALREMWDSETQLRLGQPRAALPFAYKALRLIKQVQQADRIYLPKIGSELPPIDMARRLSGKREGLATRSGAFAGVPAAPSPLDALWLALGPDRTAKPVAKRLLDDASRHLHGRGGDDGDALAVLASIDALRAEPACGECRAALRQRLWRLLPTPRAAPTPRVQPAQPGNAYLDALQREADR